MPIKQLVYFIDGIIQFLDILGEIEESKDEDIEQDTGNPQHLALLSLHFEEKRRQIEAEKQRSNEQWDQERRRLDETAFWYTIGRGQNAAKDVVGHARLEHDVRSC